jgi:aryl-alcohol dehydrogenase-like predicted oxidoreductase
MEYRRLGHSGLRVPAMSFGTATFGGGTEFFKAWGSTDVIAPADTCRWILWSTTAAASEFPCFE